jgi:hypothetical protein
MSRCCFVVPFYAADKKIIVDVMEFSLDRLMRRAPVCVVLISNDGDYAYMLSRLRNRGVKICVVHMQCTPVLVASADVELHWIRDVCASVAPVAPQLIAEASPDTKQLEMSDADFAIDLGALSRGLSALPDRSDSNLSSDGAHLCLLGCVISEQRQAIVRLEAKGIRIDGGWESQFADGSRVGSFYYQKRGVAKVQLDDRQRFREDVWQATTEGLLEAGKRILKPENPDPLSAPRFESASRWGECAEGDLSTEIYYRLTPEGREAAAGGTGTPPAAPAGE